MVFVDGTQIGTTVSDTDAHGNYTGVLHIGIHDDATNYALNGWLDEVRISKGIARWTTNFTPPTAAYS